MAYSLFWRSPALPFTQKQTAISVPAGAVVSNAASLRFTGKGATNYGKVQQENLLRLLENFAGPTAPDFPTVGQCWYDTTENNLKVCIATLGAGYPAVVWQQLNATQITGVGDAPPPNPVLGDTWFSRTGSASGIMYMYTGIGRYPQQAWDATIDYWPTTSTTAAVKLNTTTFAGAVGSGYGEAYVSAPASDTNGTISVLGVTTALPRGIIGSRWPVTDALIVWDQGGTISAPLSTYVIVQQTVDGSRWFYDNQTTLVEFTPTASQYAIGVITVGVQDDQLSPGITSATLWSTAMPLKNMMQAPAALAEGAIGGWEQIWPTVETHGGRAEYEYVYNQLAQLIGDPIIFGGSGAEGRSIPWLTDFRALDASMQLAYTNITPLDTNVSAGSYTVANGLNALKVDVNSQDWDKLLAACRYAVNRLELPSGITDDIAFHPFVQDGLPGDPNITALSGIRAIPRDRRQRNRIGGLTVFSSYQETLNVLRAAIQNRYLLKGILEASGVGNALYTNAAITAQTAFTATAASFTGTVTHGLDFVFTDSTPDVEQFFRSGGALQFIISHVPSASPTAADTALKSICDTMGRVRVLNSSTLVMSPSPSPTATLAQAPGASGFANMTSTGVTLATMTSGTATVTVRGLVVQVNFVNTRARVLFDITPGGATTGTFSVAWSYISDNEMYNNPGAVHVYPVPIAYVAAHKQGSALFI
jgi:hypothetical protein